MKIQVVFKRENSAARDELMFFFLRTVFCCSNTFCFAEWYFSVVWQQHLVSRSSTYLLINRQNYKAWWNRGGKQRGADLFFSTGLNTSFDFPSNGQFVDHSLGFTWRWLFKLLFSYVTYPLKADTAYGTNWTWRNICIRNSERLGYLIIINNEIIYSEFSLAMQHAYKRGGISV